MGPWGVLVMSFFGGSFCAWATVLAVGWHTPLLIIPVLVFVGLAAASVRKLRRSDGHIYAPSEHAKKVTSWASAAEGVGIPVVALTLANTGHQSQVLPGITAVVGLHFLPMAWAIPFRPFYASAACLLLAAALGFSLQQPAGSIIAGAAAALTLWSASFFALWRAREGRWRPAA